MLKWLAAVCVLLASSMAYAQDGPRLSPTDWKAITDARVGAVKAALQLTPDQEKYWPAVEKAIRERAEARYKRIEGFRERAKQGGTVDVIQLARARADAMAQRAATLKTLVDAWAPLQQTLTDDQKARLRFLARRVASELRPVVETRHLRTYDEQEGEGPGTDED